MDSNYLDLLREFQRHDVRYLVIGAYAVMAYTEPRFTRDLDLSIAVEPQNATKAFAALASFGAHLEGISPDDLATEGNVYRMTTRMISFDVISGLWGEDFEKAWARRAHANLGDVPINLVHIEDLLRMKQNAGRPQDLVDIDKLQKSLRVRDSELAKVVNRLGPNQSNKTELRRPDGARKPTKDRKPPSR